MERHHSHWNVKLKYSLGDLDLLAEDETSATDADLVGEKSQALRFAVKRCRIFDPNIAPVTAVGCGIRDADKYGSLQLDSLDTKYFSHSRIGTLIFEKLMGNDSCGEAVINTIGTLQEMVQNARNLRDTAAAQKSGDIGASIKERRQRVVLLDQTPEEREKTMDMFMAAMHKNGCRRLMDAVKKHDPDFVEWGKERLAKARNNGSSPLPGRDDAIERPDDGRSEDHLFGNTSDEIEHGQQRVRGLMANLEKACSPVKISPFSAWLWHWPPCSQQPVSSPPRLFLDGSQ